MEKKETNLPADCKARRQGKDQGFIFPFPLRGIFSFPLHGILELAKSGLRSDLLAGSELLLRLFALCCDSKTGLNKAALGI